MDVYIRFKMMKLDRAFEQHSNSKELKQSVRKTKRDYEMALVSWIKENPRAFHMYINNTSRRLYDKGELNKYFEFAFRKKESDISVEITRMQGQFEIKMEVLQLYYIQYLKSLHRDYYLSTMCWVYSEIVLNYINC